MYYLYVFCLSRLLSGGVGKTRGPRRNHEVVNLRQLDIFYNGAKAMHLVATILQRISCVTEQALNRRLCIYHFLNLSSVSVTTKTNVSTFLVTSIMRTINIILFASGLIFQSRESYCNLLENDEICNLIDIVLIK